MSKPTMYVTSWCPFCRDLRSDLDRLGIGYEPVDIESDPEAAAIVEELNDGNRTVPTVRYADGSAQTNPSADQVATKLAELGS